MFLEKLSGYKEVDKKVYELYGLGEEEIKCEMQSPLAPFIKGVNGLLLIFVFCSYILKVVINRCFVGADKT